MRANKHKISCKDSLIKTISEHVCKGLDIPQELLSYFSESSFNSDDKESSISSNKESNGSPVIKKPENPLNLNMISSDNCIHSIFEFTGNTGNLKQAEATNKKFKVIKQFFI